MIDQIIQLLYNALFFVTPLLMTKTTSELFEFNKMLFIYASTVLIVFFWFTKIILYKKIILKKTILDIPIIIFFLSQLASTIFSIDIHTSIFGYYGRFNGGLLSVVCYIILYYGLVSNEVRIGKILKSIIASSVIVILWAIPGHFGHDLTCLLFTGKFNNGCWDNTTLAFRPELRAFSTLGQPNWLGAYLVVAFFIGVYYLVKDIRNRIFITIYLFLNFSMILMSQSRSAILAVLAGMLLFIAYYWYFIKTNIKNILLIFILITIIPIILFKTGEEKIDKFLTFSTYKNIFIIENSSPLVPNHLVPSSYLNVTESFDIRKIVWEGAWKLALRYPLFGTGVETFAYSYNFVRPLTHNLTSEWDYVYNKAHNEYFNYLATTGFVGLISYLLLILSFIFYVFLSVIPEKTGIQMTKQNNQTILSICLFIGWVTILITNFFGFSTTTIQLFFFLIPAFLFMDNQITKQPANQPTTIFQSTTITLLLALTTYLLFSIIVYYLADVNYSYGLKYSKVNDQQKAAGYFEKALKLRSEPTYMDKFSSTLSYLAAIANIQKEAELAKQIANLSDFYNQKNIKDSPQNVFYWKTRAKNMYYFFQISGNENQLLLGVKSLENADKLAPTDPKIAYSLALYSSMLFDLSKNYTDKLNWKNRSLSEIDKVIRLKSDYREGYLFKGQLLKKYGKSSEARKVFKYLLKNFNPKDEEVLKEMQTL